jgi:hypothetical protein
MRPTLGSNGASKRTVARAIGRERFDSARERHRLRLLLIFFNNFPLIDPLLRTSVLVGHIGRISAPSSRALVITNGSGFPIAICLSDLSQLKPWGHLPQLSE